MGDRDRLERLIGIAGMLRQSSCPAERGCEAFSFGKVVHILKSTITEDGATKNMLPSPCSA
jgi:hypothetical protein